MDGLDSTRSNAMAFTGSSSHFSDPSSQIRRDQKLSIQQHTGTYIEFSRVQRRTCEEYKAELEEENYHLRSELQTEVDSNRQNERRINQLERDYFRCEQEIQTLNGEIERLENASKEEIVELKSEISSLKSRLYQAKKDIRDKENYISDLEKRLDESEEQVEKLRCRIKTISSRKNSPERGNSPDLYNPNSNLEMATITELANAIDGYLNNTTTGREILADQIKRATRQI
ncbi:hypothetical protein RhiirC2_798337, partial [Rhizophagus irregularis]